MIRNTTTRLRDSLTDHWPFSAKADEIVFQSHGELTLGIEIEFQLIDPATLNLVSRAEELLKQAGSFPKLGPEFYLSTVEINTDKCADLTQVERDLGESFDRMQTLGEQVGVRFATTGCHPFSRYADCVITPTPRYNDMIDRNQWLTRRMTVYGLHMHLGMKSGDDYIRFHNFFLQFLPHLLAFSASSPFWQGEDTGLASCRPSTYEAMPTAGQPYRVESWREFEHLYHTLKKCDAIRSLKDLWWDMRPNPGFGTLEIRVCDGPATLAETLAIVAYTHLLAHWFRDNGGWIEKLPPPPYWLTRENKWRVMRHGLEARLVANHHGETKHIRDDMAEWLEKLAPYAEKLGYGAYTESLRRILDRGNSSARQRAVFAKEGTLEAVVRHNVQEFTQRRPLDW